jgi:hypothetical protein
MKDKLIIVTLASVSLLALTLAARAGIEEGRKVIPHSWLHKTHHIPQTARSNNPSSLPSLAQVAHCMDPSLPSWAKC